MARTILRKKKKNLMYYTPSFQAILQSCNSENSTVLSKKQKNKTRHIYLWNGMHACSALSNSLWPHGLYQAPLSMGFSRQECWSGLLFPYLGDLLNPEIEPVSLVSPALAGGFFTIEPPGKPIEQNREPRSIFRWAWTLDICQRWGVQSAGGWKHPSVYASGRTGDNLGEIKVNVRYI